MANDTWYIEKEINDIKDKIFNNLEDVGKFVAGEATENVSDMNAVKTGKLRDSIEYVADKQSLSVKIGTDVEYAKFVELGTQKMPPRPFLRLAIYSNESKIVETLRK